MIAHRKHNDKPIDEVINRTNPLEKYCFFLDIKNPATSRKYEEKILKLGGQVEVFLGEGVTHIISDRPAPCRDPSGKQPGVSPSPATNSPANASLADRISGGVRCGRADAMLARCAAQPRFLARSAAQPLPLPLPLHVPVWTLDKARWFFAKLVLGPLAKALKPTVKILKGAFLKIEPFDRSNRPIYKEFDKWPQLDFSPELTNNLFMPPHKGRKGNKTKTTKTYGSGGQWSSTVKKKHSRDQNYKDRMTRKAERKRRGEEKTAAKRSGYCEICRVDYVRLSEHERSASHSEFARNGANFAALDALIGAGDAAAFLGLNGTRDKRAARRDDADGLCNGGPRRAGRPPSAGSELGPLRNGDASPASRDGRLRRPKAQPPRPGARRPRYRVVGAVASSKLRSSGGFARRRDDDAPLVVKFKKVRRSELSVLSDEAENFMFPRREDDDASDAETGDSSGRAASESPRGARLAAPPEEEEEDREEEEEGDSSGSEFTVTPRKGKRRRKRGDGAPASAKRKKTEMRFAPEEPGPPPAPPAPTPPAPAPDSDGAAPCWKWEDGRLKFSAKVENLKFSFERVPENGSWYDAFIGQYRNNFKVRDVGHCFHAYGKQKVLPFQKISLPPLKPGCCRLNEAPRKAAESKARLEALAGPSRSYGTRLRAPAARAGPGRPRKSPREHASTRAMLGGQRPALPALREDSSSDGLSTDEPAAKEPTAREMSKRLEEFMATVYDDAAEYDVPTEGVLGDVRIDAASSKPDLLRLLDTFEQCGALDAGVREARAGPPPPPPPQPRRRKRGRGRPPWKRPRLPSDGSAESAASADPAPSPRIDVAGEWGSSAERLSDENSSDERPLRELQRRARAALQPVVRVRKMDESSSSSSGRRLRSARPSRAHRYAHR